MQQSNEAMRYGNGWRRGKEGSKGKGKSGATMELILMFMIISVLWRH